MLIELAEKILGYSQWTEAVATFGSTNMQATPHSDRAGNVSYTYSSNDVIHWTDTKGEIHYAQFVVPDDSALYQMVNGDTATIRYDPRNPDKFYYRDLLKTRVNTWVKRCVFVLILLALVLMSFMLR